MKIVVAGATGVIGRLLTPMLVDAGHVVYASSRTDRGVAVISGMGAHGIRCDVLDAGQTAEVITDIAPAAVINEVTDLAGFDFAANAHARRVGTHHLVEAALAAGVDRFVTQSIAWAYRPGTAPATESEPLDVDAPEPRLRTVQGVVAAEADAQRLPSSTVLRYGALYGPGTWYSAGGRVADRLRAGTLRASTGVASFVHVLDAARAAVAALGWPSGIVNVVDDRPAPGAEWVEEMRRRLGVETVAELAPAAAWERGADNARLHALGFVLRYPTWRGHLTASAAGAR